MFGFPSRSRRPSYAAESSYRRGSRSSDDSYTRPVSPLGSSRFERPSRYVSRDQVYEVRPRESSYSRRESEISNLRRGESISERRDRYETSRPLSPPRRESSSRRRRYDDDFDYGAAGIDMSGLAGPSYGGTFTSSYGVSSNYATDSRADDLSYRMEGFNMSGDPSSRGYVPWRPGMSNEYRPRPVHRSTGRTPEFSPATLAPMDEFDAYDSTRPPHRQPPRPAEYREYRPSTSSGYGSGYSQQYYESGASRRPRW